MDNGNTGKTSWRQTCRPTKRRLIQLYAAVLYNAYAKGFVKGDIYRGKTKRLCVPGLNCYSCPAAVGACPLGALQNALAASGNRTGFYVFGILMLWGLMLGRTVCGWLCPFGMIQELLYRIPTPKLGKNRFTRKLSCLKYVFLVLFVLTVPLWYGLRHGTAVPAFCKYICPAGTLEGAAGLLSHPANAGFFRMLGPVFTLKTVLLLALCLACVFCSRVFCRFICPLGAIYGLFNRIAVVGVRVDPGRCTGCGACVMHCRMDVRHVGDRECISCAECMDVCRYDAISLKAGKITLKAPSGDIPAAGPGAEGNPVGRGKAVRTAALAVLISALLWYNVFYSPEEAAGTGSAPGDMLPDFTVECLDGETFRLEECRGKTVFINLWATYCGPCVEELPYFDALAEKYPDDIAVLAVHNSMTVDDIPAYLADRGWDTISFALDTEDGLVWDLVGGGSTMPQTIVLDREGRVIYNEVGSVSPGLLEELFSRASSG